MSLVYNKFKKLEADGTIDLGTASSIKVMLVGSTYTANADHNFVNPSVYQCEVNGVGYTPGYGGSGRKTLANWTFTQDDTNDRCVVGVTPSVWSGFGPGFTVSGAVIIRERAGTGDTMSELIAFINGSPFPFAGVGSTVTITWGDLLYLT